MSTTCPGGYYLNSVGLGTNAHGERVRTLKEGELEEYVKEAKPVEVLTAEEASDEADELAKHNKKVAAAKKSKKTPGDADHSAVLKE